MPCSCGHISCLCGIPCLCEASVCKCKDCAEAVGRVCKMCNKAFYYECLVLKQTKEEEICRCFMVKSMVHDKTSAFQSFETHGMYSQAFTSNSNNFKHQNTEQLAQNYPPHILESSSVQSNYPCGSEHFGTTPFDPSGQGYAFFPQQENGQSVNPHMGYSENTIPGQPEFNYTDNIQESANMQNSSHTSIENSAQPAPGPMNGQCFIPHMDYSENTIPGQPEFNYTDNIQVSANMQNSSHTNFGNSTHQAPEQMEENRIPTSSDFPKQPNEEQGHPSQRTQKFYKIPGETYPVFINLRSSSLNPSSIISECRAATLKWLRTVPDLEVDIHSCDLIKNPIE